VHVALVPQMVEPLWRQHSCRHTCKGTSQAHQGTCQSPTQGMPGRCLCRVCCVTAAGHACGTNKCEARPSVSQVTLCAAARKSVLCQYTCSRASFGWHLMLFTTCRALYYRVTLHSRHTLDLGQLQQLQQLTYLVNIHVFSGLDSRTQQSVSVPY
jgi:hypothetical protein